MKTYAEEQLQAEGYKQVLADYFVGKAYLKSLVSPDGNTICIISAVLLELVSATTGTRMAAIRSYYKKRAFAFIRKMKPNCAFEL